jgi:hypothetical protein
MATTIKAPWPNYKVTSILPNPQFEDTRSTESTVIVKRTMTGVLWTYKVPSDRVSLSLPFRLTRMKSLELEAVLNSYQAAPLWIELYDGSQWEAKLVGEPIIRTATERIGTSTLIGKELIDVTLILSAKRLN